MQKRNIIRNGLAGLMLILFSFSITPRYFLHQWFADHQDSRGTVPAGGQDYVSHVLTNCHCDNLVVESPFTSLEEPLYENLEIPFPQYSESIQQGSPGTSCLSFSLRGPPAVS